MAENRWLIMTEGPQAGQHFVLDQDWTTIGRDPGSNIVVVDPQISRQHARITRQQGFLVIEDLGSTNGTFVNGARLTRAHTLVAGDVVGLGNSVTLSYREAAANGDTAMAQPAATPPQAYSPAGPQPAAGHAPPFPSGPSAARADRSTPRPGRTWLLLGCGCLVMVFVFACVAVLVLDQLSLLPAFFYQPLFWLGLDRLFAQ
jgi:pSer/pThr/pTyr-binding forkhead associated (FHA) protein